MYLLTRHIQKTVDRIDEFMDGWTFGRLVVLESAHPKHPKTYIRRAYLEQDNGALIPIKEKHIVQIRNDDRWERATLTDLTKISADGWPAYAGLEVRIQMRGDELANHILG